MAQEVYSSRIPGQVLTPAVRSSVSLTFALPGIPKQVNVLFHLSPVSCSEVELSWNKAIFWLLVSVLIL